MEKVGTECPGAIFQRRYHPLNVIQPIQPKSSSFTDRAGSIPSLSPDLFFLLERARSTPPLPKDATPSPLCYAPTRYARPPTPHLVILKIWIRSQDTSTHTYCHVSIARMDAHALTVLRPMRCMPAKTRTGIVRWRGHRSVAATHTIRVRTAPARFVDCGPVCA